MKKATWIAMFSMFVFLGVTFMPGESHALTAGTYYSIYGVEVQEDGDVLVRMNGSDTNWYKVAPDCVGEKNMLTLLLTAFTAGRTVAIWFNTSNQITVIRMS